MREVPGKHFFKAENHNVIYKVKGKADVIELASDYVLFDQYEELGKNQNFSLLMARFIKDEIWQINNDKIRLFYSQVAVKIEQGINKNYLIYKTENEAYGILIQLGVSVLRNMDEMLDMELVKTYKGRRDRFLKTFDNVMKRSDFIDWKTIYENDKDLIDRFVSLFDKINNDVKATQICGASTFDSDLKILNDFSKELENQKLPLYLALLGCNLGNESDLNGLSQTVKNNFPLLPKAFSFNLNLQYVLLCYKNFSFPPKTPNHTLFLNTFQALALHSKTKEDFITLWDDLMKQDCFLDKLKKCQTKEEESEIGKIVDYYLNNKSEFEKYNNQYKDKAKLQEDLILFFENERRSALEAELVGDINTNGVKRKKNGRGKEIIKVESNLNSIKEWLSENTEICKIEQESAKIPEPSTLLEKIETISLDAKSGFQFINQKGSKAPMPFLENEKLFIILDIKSNSIYVLNMEKISPLARDSGIKFTKEELLNLASANTELRSLGVSGVKMAENNEAIKIKKAGNAGFRIPLSNSYNLKIGGKDYKVYYSDKILTPVQSHEKKHSTILPDHIKKSFLSEASGASRDVENPENKEFKLVDNKACGSAGQGKHFL